MACCLFGANYPNQCWLIVNRTPGNKFQWNLNRNSTIFIQENSFEKVVCQNGGRLSRERWVNRQGYNQNSQHFVDANGCWMFLEEKYVFRIKLHWKLFTRLQLSTYTWSINNNNKNYDVIWRHLIYPPECHSNAYRILATITKCGIYHGHDGSGIDMIFNFENENNHRAILKSL